MKRKMVAGLLIAALLLCGCGAGNAGNESGPTMTIDYVACEDGTQYTRYNGDAQEFFHVASGRENVVEVAVQRESGKLRITIQEEGNPENTLYDGNTFPSESFTVNATEPGRYRIWVHAENFIGTYHFSYDTSQ